MPACNSGRKRCLRPSHPHSKCTLLLRSEEQLRFEWGWEGDPLLAVGDVKLQEGERVRHSLQQTPRGVDFEKVWKDRDTHLEKVPGFKNFNLVRREIKENHTLYASHSIWNSKEAFIDWTKSEAFRLVHKNAAQHRDLYLGAPNLEGFEVVL